MRVTAGENVFLHDAFRPTLKCGQGIEPRRRCYGMTESACRVAESSGDAPNMFSAPGPAPKTWSTSVFGLELRGAFHAPGLEVPSAGGRLSSVHVGLVSKGKIDASWRPSDARRLLHWQYNDGRDIMTVDHDPDLGYRLFAIRQGLHLLSSDGAWLSCAPPDDEETWFWQRYLVSQVLPLAAVVHGYELLHASAIALDGQTVAFAGDSGAGKTSVALNLVLRGHQFVTDDVVSISVTDSGPLVHPGPGLTNLRRQEDRNMGDRRSLLGDVIGQDDAELRVALRPSKVATPLRALYVIERGHQDGVPRFVELADVGFDFFVPFSFTRFLSNPSRWRRQLHAYSAMAKHVRIFRLQVPESMGAAQLSAHVEAHVHSIAR